MDIKLESGQFKCTVDGIPYVVHLHPGDEYWTASITNTQNGAKELSLFMPLDGIGTAIGEIIADSDDLPGDP